MLSVMKKAIFIGLLLSLVLIVACSDQIEPVVQEVVEDNIQENIADEMPVEDSEPQEPVNQGSCIDTDNGDNSEERGTATGLLLNGIEASKSDDCNEEANELFEYFCDGDNIKYKIYQCETCHPKELGLCGSEVEDTGKVLQPRI